MFVSGASSPGVWSFFRLLHRSDGKALIHAFAWEYSVTTIADRLLLWKRSSLIAKVHAIAHAISL